MYIPSKQAEKAYKNLDTIRAHGTSCIILQHENEPLGYIIGRYSKSGGKLYVTCKIHWKSADEYPLIAYACASGYGYNKLNSCMSQIFYDHRAEFDAHDITWRDKDNLEGGTWRDKLEEAGYEITQIL